MPPARTITLAFWRVAWLQPVACGSVDATECAITSSAGGLSLAAVSGESHPCRFRFAEAGLRAQSPKVPGPKLAVKCRSQSTDRTFAGKLWTFVK